MVDKNFTYQVIEELRRTAAGKPAGDFDKILMLGAANIMETNIRAYLDIASEPTAEADAAPWPCREKCTWLRCKENCTGCEFYRTA